jgi:heme O synthase-like polyprenyltransferase
MLQKIGMYILGTFLSTSSKTVFKNTRNIGFEQLINRTQNRFKVSGNIAVQVFLSK